jgi:hypothetical protein
LQDRPAGVLDHHPAEPVAVVPDESAGHFPENNTPS